nr:hypothetical protein [Grifola frondosa]
MRTNGMSLHKLPFNNIVKNKYHINRNYTKKVNNHNQINKNQFNEWFVGFVYGEGNFSIGIDNRGKYPRFNYRFMIGLHIDDKPLLEFIKNKLGCGLISINKDNTAAYFTISNISDLKSVILPIFEGFPLNGVKHLDYLDFKEALLLESPNTSKSSNKLDDTNKILELKNKINKNRTEYSLPLDHIRITPYWLLGFIEGEGSFHLRRTSLTPTFSLALTYSQLPLIEAII